MTNKIRAFLFIFLALVITIVSGIFIVSFFTNKQPSFAELIVPEHVLPIAEITTGSVDSAPSGPWMELDGKTSPLIRQAYQASDTWMVEAGTRIILVPHHLVAAREIASLFSALEPAQTVFVLTPDHFSRGKTPITLADASWHTSEGDLYGDSELTQSLAASLPMARVSNDVAKEELAVQALLPMLAHRMRDTHVVPIMMHPDASPEDRIELASVLVERLKQNPHAILIVSVDFSHYLPAFVADFHDALAEDVVRGLANLETDRVELDAPSVLAVGLKTARDLGLGEVTVHAHTNSLRIMKATISQESTSHLIASFAPGPVQKQSVLSLLFLGDTMLDRHVATRSKNAGSLEYPFQKILGTENRFFQGQDLVIANLEGPVSSMRRDPNKGEVDFMFDPKVAPMLKEIGIDAVSQANNHTLDQGRVGADESRKFLSQAGLAVFGDQVRDDAASSLTVLDRRGQKIAILGFNITDNPLDQKAAEAALTSAYEQANRVVIYIHWGNEYQSNPTMKQTELAHWFIDQGADAVIGAHPHWMQSVEVYRNRPIIYSLGNFIFDQDWSKETNFGLVAGLVLDENQTRVHLFPIQIIESQPRILTGTDRQTRLDRLADISDPGLSSELKKGVLLLKQ